MTEPKDAGLTALLLQMPEYRSRLDAAEAEAARISAALSAVAVNAQRARKTAEDQATVLVGLAGLPEAVSKLAEDVAGLLPPNVPPNRYRPGNTVRWWMDPDRPPASWDAAQAAELRTEQDQGRERIRHWVRVIYGPRFGHLSRLMGTCWERHPLCWGVLDWLSELWAVLHTSTPRSARDLSEQFEFYERVLPLAAAQLGTETKDCTCPKPGPAANGRKAGAA